MWVLKFTGRYKITKQPKDKNSSWLQVTLDLEPKRSSQIYGNTGETDVLFVLVANVYGVVCISNVFILFFILFLFFVIN